MQGKRVLISALVFALISAVITVGGALRGSRQSDAPAQRESAEETGAPVVDFNAPAPADVKEQALRRARSKLYDYAGDPAEALKFTLTETAEPIILDLPVSDGPQESSIPVQQADAVVIGKITDARAYLSNDKTNVYSEFTASLEDVLLDNSSASLFTGAAITTQRHGGVIRFPSGKTVERGALGRTMPQRGGRYLLFLKQNKEGQAFSIITGYALRNGRVIPLDGLSRKVPQLAHFAVHENADETTFLNQVRDAISKGRN